jgi:hypothetical protein
MDIHPCVTIGSKWRDSVSGNRVSGGIGSKDCHTTSGITSDATLT